MNITILTLGTTGDVAPFCALTRKLVMYGHDVTFSSYEEHRAAATAAGARFHATPGSVRHIAGAGRRLLGHASFSAWMLACTTRRRRIVEAGLRIMEPMWQACSGANLVVFNSTAAFGASIAEAMGLPSLQIAFMPQTPTRAFAAPLWPNSLSLTPFRPLSHWASTAWRNEPYRAAVNALRGRLRLAPLSPGDLSRRLDDPAPPIFYAFSPQAVPPPADWGPNVVVGGYLNEEGPPLDPALEAFLSAGPPPVYFGLGSAVLTADETAASSAAIVRATRELGCRAVVHSGWNGLCADVCEPDIHVVPHASHISLFPRCACILHHGGCSTTGAALAAGRPQALAPQGVDNPFWAARMEAIGVAPAALARGPLDARRLVDALRKAMSDPAITLRASEVRQKLEGENGPVRAIEMIESLERTRVLQA